MSSIEYPTQFEPYAVLKVGSNVFSGARALIAFGGRYAPVLVGRGTVPRVWLSVPGDSSGAVWYPVVKDNFAAHPGLFVESRKGWVGIRTATALVLAAAARSTDEVAIEALDLRPFGMDIYTDGTKLHVMGNTLSGNTFVGAEVGIGIGMPPSDAVPNS